MYEDVRGKINREHIRESGIKKTSIVVRDVVICWVLIIAIIILNNSFHCVWLALVSIPFIGALIYSLAIIAHDGFHRNIHDNVLVNDLICDVLILGPLFATVRINRKNHMLHHRFLYTKNDPDLYKYRSDNKKGFVRFVYFFFFRSIWSAIKNVFLDPSLKEKYLKREKNVIVVWQILIILSLSFMFGWYGYIVFWLIPIYFFAYIPDMVRAFAEHSSVNDKAFNKLVTFTPNWVERFFISPKNMNYHMVHHLWPFIPYYNLKKIDTLLKRNDYSEYLEWRSSYVKYIYLYLKSK